MFEVRLVNSEFIALVGYNQDTNALRVITYRNSTVAGYDYKHVPRRVFDSLAMAPSVGSLFNRIKTDYSHNRLDPTAAFEFYRKVIAATASARVIAD